MTSIKQLKSLIFGVLLLANMNGQAQDNLSHIFFANQSRLPITLNPVLSGNTAAVTTGKLSFLPYEITHDHLTTITPGDFINLPEKDHNENNSSLRCVRSRAAGANQFQAELEVWTGGDKLFTILIGSKDSAGSGKTRLYYNIRYSNGSLENPHPGLLLRDDNNGQVQVATDIIFDGQAYKLVYGVFNENVDITDNIVFSMSNKTDTVFRYDPPLSDTSNPDILNVYCYNPGLLMPLGLSDQDEDERTLVFHKAMPKNMDFIVFQEFFEPQKVAVIFRNLAPYYPYHTGPHNRILIPTIGKDGGVRIVSKYPILEEREVSYSENGCVPEDFFSKFANKGVKYAKINKQGQIIHIFGTHTSEQPCDLYVMGQFMAGFDISKDDIVVMAGDFNVDMNHYDNGEDVYTIMLDTINALEPTYISFLNDRSYVGSTSGLNHFYCCNPEGRQHLDYIFASSKHKIPYRLTNHSMQARLNEPDESFGIFDMGDHEPLYARIEFPALSVKRQTISNCIDNTVELHTSLVKGDTNGYYQWYKNDEAIPGANDTVLLVSLQAAGDFGTYTCRYEYIYLPDTVLNNFFDPAYMNYEWIFRGYTPGNIEATFHLVPSDSGIVCLGIPLAVPQNRPLPFIIYPNPARDVLELNSPENIADLNISLLDVTGRSLSIHPIGGGPNQARFDIAGLAPGMYFISAVFNGSVYSLPFVKI